ncbi:uncharacterized protein [Euwallacea fornicatus]|uniref:uncharacterized protein isoform X2 n=1 Tax=Euwallacea fornicatus TaxID=995702 RepID=UPI00338EEE70
MVTSAFTILVLFMALATHIETRAVACRPLPQCCRRYVFSAGCRGVAAKRNSNLALPESVIDDLFRDPRTPTPDSEVMNSNIDHLILNLSDDDSGPLQHLRKNSIDDPSDYSSN